jgi:hypothetical protein
MFELVSSRYGRRSGPGSWNKDNTTTGQDTRHGPTSSSV